LLIKAGTVQGIVAGMTIHNEEIEIVDVAIRVLTNLASDLDEENQAIMAQEGAVQAIVEVADQYSMNVDMEQAALGCLCNLGREEYNADMIIRQGGTEAVIKAMRDLADQPSIIIKGCQLISILTLRSIPPPLFRHTHRLSA
jgi:hypothetical protein